MELQDIRTITSSWGIDVIEKKVLSERVTLISTGGQQTFILKKKGSVQQFERELKLLNHLKQNDFPTQYPVINQQGQYALAFNDETYCLYDYLEGRTYSSAESLQNPIVPQLLGETIANLNQVMSTIDFTSEYPNKDLYQMVYGFAVPEIQKVEESEQLNKIYQDLEEDIKQVVHALPQQLVHRDAHIHNIIVNDDILTGVIDYDIAEVNVRLFDLCYCSTSVLSEVFSDEKLRASWIHFVGELVGHYHQYNPLTDQERKSIWYVLLCIQTVFMAYFAKYKDIYEMNKAMLMWIYDHRVYLENEVLLKTT